MYLVGWVENHYKSVFFPVFLSEYYPLAYGMAVKMVGSNLPALNIAFFNFVFTPIIAILYTVALMIVVRVLERLKLSRILFGK